MKPLTIVYTTSRKMSRFRWFIESLRNQCQDEPPRIILIDATFPSQNSVMVRNEHWDAPLITITTPKPTVWQGKHRVTREDWWAASNARNTGIALCETEWIAFLDDRCVLQRGWLDGVRRAMDGNYCVAGAYEKRTGMTVEAGHIKNGGIVTGVDSRLEYCRKFYDPDSAPYPAPGEWTYGCNLALPLEWALTVNGFDETCDGQGAEDCMFGLMLQNNSLPIRYDPAMMMIEDRTPAECLPVMRREDKGVSPNDKSHFLLDLLRTKKHAMHPFSLRDLRASALAEEPWPKPWGPTHDPFDGQPISEFQ